jgi:short-subunit dehydrogenase
MAEQEEKISAVSKDKMDSKVAVITGASSGIGRATAIEFAQAGYNMVLTARRQNELKATADEAKKYGVQAIAVAADTTDEAALKKVADAAVKNFGHFNVWVNDAAVSMFGKFDEAPMEDFRRVIETNFFGYVNGARQAIKQFKNQDYGTLINISSVTAAAPQPYTSAYVSSKYAIRGLGESLRMELKLDNLQDKIFVCTAMPASIDTNLFQNAANSTGREPQALEPVYDPAYVAKHIVKLAERPKREVIIGPAGKMMAMEHSMAPTLYEKFAARFIDRDHLSDQPAGNTHGNLYEPVNDNTGMRGGWRETRLRADRMNAAIGTGLGILLAGAGAAYAYNRSRRQNHHR